MAKHKTFESLGKKLIKISERANVNVQDVVRKAALAADQVAVITTPVDTGFARSRWVVTIGEPLEQESVNERIELGEELATTIALSQGAKEINKWNGIGSIFINNPLDYVKYLDEGSSEQAPEGMTAQAIQAGKQVLKELKILDD